MMQHTGNRFIDTDYGKFDSRMTKFLYQAVCLNGFGDELTSNEAGQWAERIGKRIVYGDSQGFVYSERKPNEALAIQAFDVLRESLGG